MIKFFKKIFLNEYKSHKLIFSKLTCNLYVIINFLANLINFRGSKIPIILCRSFMTSILDVRGPVTVSTVRVFSFFCSSNFQISAFYTNIWIYSSRIIWFFNLGALPGKSSLENFFVKICVLVHFNPITLKITEQ